MSSKAPVRSRKRAPRIRRSRGAAPEVAAAVARAVASVPVRIEVTPRADHAESEVNHPRYYTSHPSGVECITVAEYLPFNLGSALKYIWRAGLKSGESADVALQKALFYITRERGRLAAAAAKP